MTGPARQRKSRLPAVLSLLLLLAAALFTLGISIEHSTKSSRTNATTATTAISGTGESTEGQAAHGENSELAAGEHAAGHVETTAENERILGIRTDTAAAVTGMLIASVLTAVAVWRRPRRITLAGAGAFAAAATVFDIAEVLHQNTEGRTNVQLVAAIVAAAHLTAVAIAVTAIARLHQPSLVASAT
jgi:hypothetical protein